MDHRSCKHSRHNRCRPVLIVRQSHLKCYRSGHSYSTPYQAELQRHTIQYRWKCTHIEHITQTLSQTSVNACSQMQSSSRLQRAGQLKWPHMLKSLPDQLSCAIYLLLWNFRGKNSIKHKVFKFVLFFLLRYYWVTW